MVNAALVFFFGSLSLPSALHQAAFVLVCGINCVFAATPTKILPATVSGTVADQRDSAVSQGGAATYRDGRFAHPGVTESTRERMIRREVWSEHRAGAESLHCTKDIESNGARCIHGVPVFDLSASEGRELARVAVDGTNVASFAELGANTYGPQAAWDADANVTSLPITSQELWIFVIGGFDDHGKTAVGTTDDLKQFCEDLKRPVRCRFQGAPSNGGVPLVVVQANLMDIEIILRHSGRFVRSLERDKEVLATICADVPPPAVQSQGVPGNVDVVRGNISLRFHNASSTDESMMLVGKEARVAANNTKIKRALESAISLAAGLGQAAAISSALEGKVSRSGEHYVNMSYEIRLKLNRTLRAVQNHLGMQSINSMRDLVTTAMSEFGLGFDVEVLDIVSAAPQMQLGIQGNQCPSFSSIQAQAMNGSASEPGTWTFSDESSTLTHPSELQKPWHLRRIVSRRRSDDTSARKPHLGGRGVHVYVLDTGISFLHKEFQGHAVPTIETHNGYIRECDFHVTDCASDEHGHGTGMASLIGGRTYGVATGVVLHSAKVIGKSGVGSLVNVLQATDWIMRHAQSPSVISVSLTTRGRSRALELALEIAVAQRNITIVVEAGDAGESACDYAPANVNAVLTVGALSQDDRLPTFANHGTCVDLVAPGVDIDAADINSEANGSRRMSTSGASTAMVAGAAALVLGDDRGALPAQVERMLVGDATSLFDPPVGKLLFIGKPAPGREAPGTLQKKSMPLYPYDVRKWSTEVSGHDLICKSGTSQSPVDLPDCDRGLKASLQREKLEANWGPARVHLIHTGNSIKMEFEVDQYSNLTTSFGYEQTDGGIMPIQFRLVSCEFHVGSEHEVRGERQAMEMKCLHARAVASICGKEVSGFMLMYGSDERRGGEAQRRCSTQAGLLQRFDALTLAECASACAELSACSTFEYGDGLRGQSCRLFSRCQSKVKSSAEQVSLTYQKCEPEEPKTEHVSLSFLFKVHDQPNAWLQNFEDQLPINMAIPGKIAPVVRSNRIMYLSSYNGGPPGFSLDELWRSIDPMRYYSYMGSLSIPPCTEGVQTYVVADPLPIGQAQVDKFANAIDAGGANFRPPQPLGQRCVKDCSGYCHDKPMRKIGGKKIEQLLPVESKPAKEIRQRYHLKGLAFNSLTNADQTAIRMLIQKTFMDQFDLGKNDASVDVLLSAFETGRRRRVLLPMPSIQIGADVGVGIGRRSLNKIRIAQRSQKAARGHGSLARPVDVNREVLKVHRHGKTVVGTDRASLADASRPLAEPVRSSESEVDGLEVLTIITLMTRADVKPAEIKRRMIRKSAAQAYFSKLVEGIEMLVPEAKTAAGITAGGNKVSIIARPHMESSNTHSQPEPFDCSTGKVSGWAKSKLQWCCENKKKGCNAYRQEASQENAARMAARMDEYKVNENTSEQELPLPAWTRNFGKASCPCVGIAGLSGTTSARVRLGEAEVFVRYPMDVGSSCHDWDNGRVPGACVDGDQDPGIGSGWCAQPWCYVDPCACDLGAPPSKATYFPGVTFQGKSLWYSYETCGGNNYHGDGQQDGCGGLDAQAECDQQEVCSWSHKKRKCLSAAQLDECAKPYNPVQVMGKEECQCVGFRDLPGTTTFVLGSEKVEYPASDGAVCSAWDNGRFPGGCTEERASELGPGFGRGWCAARWCFVDPCRCDFPWLVTANASYLPQAAFQGRPLAISYATCSDDQSTPTEATTSCTKLNTSKACSRLGAGTCVWTPVGCVRKESLATCRELYTGMGWTTSTTTFAPSSFTGHPECPCIGIIGLPGETQATIDQHMVSYPMDVGSSCQAWDDGRFPRACVDEEEQPGMGQGWCKASWCYVSPCECNLPTSPIKGKYFVNARAQGRPLFYSYATCGEADDYSVREPPVSPAVGSKKLNFLWVSDGTSKCVMPFDSARLVLGEHFLEFPQTSAQECKAKCEAEPRCLHTEVPRMIVDHGNRNCLLLLKDSYLLDCEEPNREVFSIDVVQAFGTKSKYVEVSTNTADCPDGYAALTEPTACEEAVTQFNQGYSGSVDVVEQDNLPYGCVYNKQASSSAQLNIATGGTAEVYVSLYCKLITAVSWNWLVDRNVGGVVDQTSLQSGSLYSKFLGTADSRAEAEMLAHSSPKGPFEALVWFHDDYENEDIRKSVYGVLGVSADLDTKTEVQSVESAVHAGANQAARSFAQKEVYVAESIISGRSRENEMGAAVQETCTEKFGIDACVAANSRVPGGCRWLSVPSPGKCVSPEVEQACSRSVDYQVFGHAHCRCVGIAYLNGLTQLSIGGEEPKSIEYPGDVGATCHSWDHDRYPRKCTNGGEEPWCLHRWCYVDKCQCEMANTEIGLQLSPESSHLMHQGRPVYKFGATCEDYDNVSGLAHQRTCMHRLHEDACDVMGDQCVWTGQMCVPKGMQAECMHEWATTTSTTTTIKLGSQRCPCIGIANRPGVTTLNLNNRTVEYPNDFGTSCRAWDDGLFPDACERLWQNPGSGKGFCGQPWCFVDPCQCDLMELPQESKYLPQHRYQGRALFYSYETCGGKDYWSAVNRKRSCRKQTNKHDCETLANCLWSDSEDPPVCMGRRQAEICEKPTDFNVSGRVDCRCIGIQNAGDGVVSLTKVSIEGMDIPYPADVGSHCKAWDAGQPPICSQSRPSDPGQGEEESCAERWCFVDPCKCSLSVPPLKSHMLSHATSNGKPLFISYATCGGKYTWGFSTNSSAQECSTQDTEDECAAVPESADKGANCVWTGSQCLRMDLLGVCATDFPQVANVNKTLGTASSQAVPLSEIHHTVEPAVEAPKQMVATSDLLPGTTAKPTEFPLPVSSAPVKVTDESAPNENSRDLAVLSRSS